MREAKPSPAYPIGASPLRLVDVKTAKAIGPGRQPAYHRHSGETVDAKLQFENSVGTRNEIAMN